MCLFPRQFFGNVFYQLQRPSESHSLKGVISESVFTLDGDDFLILLNSYLFRSFFISLQVIVILSSGLTSRFVISALIRS
jgi:hypothetical protein